MRVRRAMMAGMFTAAVGLAAATPAAAQGGTVITIFGNDKCPVSNGEQTNICVRAPESDRYRVPENLRATDAAAPEATARVEAMQSTGRAGIGSCSVGNGSFTGCQLEEIRKAAAEKRAAKAAAPVID